MSQLSQKLHYKLDGTTDEITLYSTLGEVNNKGLNVKVNGINAYAGYGPATNGEASRMNYKPPVEVAQKILKNTSLNPNRVFRLQLYRNNDALIMSSEFPMTVPIGDTFYLNNENAPMIAGYDFVMAIPNNFMVTEDTANNLPIKVYYIPQEVADREETNFAAYSTYAEGDLSMRDFLNTYSGTLFASMFEGSNITKAPKLNTSNGVNMQRMFRTCTYLQSIYPLDTKGNATFSGMFQDCLELDFTINNANVFDFTNAISISMMFTGCTKITADKPIHLKNVPTSLNLSLIGTKHYIVDNYI